MVSRSVKVSTRSSSSALASSAADGYGDGLCVASAFFLLFFFSSLVFIFFVLPFSFFLVFDLCCPLFSQVLVAVTVMVSTLRASLRPAPASMAARRIVLVSTVSLLERSQMVRPLIA